MAFDPDLLRRIDGYLDAAPRSAARAEAVGPFTLFVRQGAGWPYYARPTPGADTFEGRDVHAVRARQRRLGIPESIEWIPEVSPGVGPASSAAGLDWHLHPLMIQNPDAFLSTTAPPADAEVRTVSPDEDLRTVRAVAAVAFAHSGMETGPQGVAELKGAAGLAAADGDGALLGFLADRMARALTVTVAAFVNGSPVAVGSHQPVGDTTEIVGVGTLPAFRRRGLAAAVTAALTSDARDRGIRLVFLSAGSEEVARTYERVGFRRAGSAGTAEPPEEPSPAVTPPGR